MGLAQARDGRESLAFILTKAATETTTGSLAVGDIVVVTAKASTGSIFDGIEINHFFMANKSLTLGTGDKCYKCTPHFLGQATGKTVSSSKNTTDVTIDYDGSANNVCDGIVTKTGSISGSYITELLASTSGVNIIKKRFDSITEIDADGEATYAAASTAAKDLVMIIWNGRTATTTDYIEVEMIPALFTGLSKGGQYNSSQTFDLDFTGCDTDDNGFIGGILQVKNATGLIPAITRAAYEGE